MTAYISDMDTKQLKGLMPDASDKKNITQAIRNYEQTHPGEIAHCILQARKETVRDTNKRTTKLKDGPVFRLAMPLGLSQYLKQNYPTLITDKGQFEWFLKNFSDFDLTK